MARKKVNSEDDLINEPFDFEKAVKVGPGGLTKEVLLKAKAKAKSVDEMRANKVLKSVRYDEDLLVEIQKVADEEGIPYQTLMNSLLKTGLKVRRKGSGIDIIERLERIEKKLFAKIG